MKIISVRTIHGPNVYHHLPVVIMTVDLEEWAECASNEVENFVESLLTVLPGLIEHRCSVGERGGFVQRLRRGTYMAHIIEHVALEISSLTGQEVYFGKTRNIGKPGHYEIVTRFLSEEGMKECLRTAFHLIESLLHKKSFDLKSAVSEVRHKVEDSQWGPSSGALLRAARRRGIPYRRIGCDSLIELGYGKNLRRLQTAVTDRTGLIAAELVQDKDLTKEFLSNAFVPVPYGKVISEEKELDEVCKQIPPPLAIKPLDGNHGNGVSLNLKTKEEMLLAFHLAKSFCSKVLVEEMIQGRDYRVLVVDGKLSAASERKPPAVLGDGVRNIQTLLEELNSDPRRGEGHSNTLSRVQVDEALIDTLRRQKMELTSIPLLGQEVILRENANLSSGGMARDVTNEVHPEVRILCERVARLTGLDICGIDLIHTDISKAPGKTLKIIEVNAGPGLRMHLSPSEGKTQPVADHILQMMYPDPLLARIPIVGVTGTNGKTTVVRLLSHILSKQDVRVGLTSTDGVWIGKDKILSGDCSGPASAMTVLTDPSVETAVLEIARGGLLRGGLAYDWADVGIITNIRADHLGQDGIESVEDLVWIKSLVAEQIREGGTLVLNADDEESAQIAHSSRIQEIPRRILLYSTEARNPLLVRHLHGEGDACWVEKGWIYCCRRGRVFQIGRVLEIPITFNGIAQFQVSNVLAAISGAIGLGFEPREILPALQSFTASANNRGRLNLYKIHNAYVLVDYGHNPDAIRAVGQILQSFEFSRKTLLFGLPGDRDTELIKESGMIAARIFDRLFVRDDQDLRGRTPMEVPLIIKTLMAEKKMQVECAIVQSESETLLKILNETQDREVIVALYEHLGPLMEILRQFDPQPLESFDMPVLQVNSVSSTWYPGNERRSFSP